MAAHDKQAEAVATFGLRQVEIAGERFEEETSKSWPSADIAAGHSGHIYYRTDWPFTSCCFPPRVTATQVQADYELR